MLAVQWMGCWARRFRSQVVAKSFWAVWRKAVGNTSLNSTNSLAYPSNLPKTSPLPSPHKTTLSIVVRKVANNAIIYTRVGLLTSVMMVSQAAVDMLEGPICTDFWPTSK